jgi:hypothetical protein
MHVWVPISPRVVRENDIYTVNTSHSKIVGQNDSNVNKQAGHLEVSSTETGQ